MKQQLPDERETTICRFCGQVTDYDLVFRRCVECAVTANKMILDALAEMGKKRRGIPNKTK